MTATIPVGPYPCGVAVDPAAGTVYVANEDGGGNGWVSVIDAATGTVTDTLGAGFGPDAVAVDPATQTVYVTDTGDNTVYADAENGNQVATIPVGDTPNAVAVDAAVGTVYVTNATDYTVSVIEAATGARDRHHPRRRLPERGGGGPRRPDRLRDQRRR